MHVARLAADESLVRFDLAGEFAECPSVHCVANPLKHEPWSQEFTDELDLATIFQIKRGGTFTVKVRRSRDLPQVDFTGAPLRELSATLVVKGGPGGRDY